MRHRALILCLLPVTLALPARAQSDADEAACVNRSGSVPAEQVMAACNRLTADTNRRTSIRAQDFAWRGAANLRANQRDAAMADFNQALALDADNFQARLVRAQLRAQARDYQAALDDFDAAEKLEPKNVAVHFQRSSLYLILKRYPEAIADADFGNGGASMLNQRCWTRAVAGVELDKARTACEQALWAEPDSTAILDSRGLVNLKQQRWQEAWDDYNTALKPGRFASALYGRGLAALKLGKDTEGRADLAAATQLRREIADDYAGYGLKP